MQRIAHMLVCTECSISLIATCSEEYHLTQSDEVCENRTKVKVAYGGCRYSALQSLVATA